MKNLGVIIVFLIVMCGGAYMGYYLYQKNQEEPIVYESTTPFVTTIIKKTVANGSVNPRKEVALKPQVTGILDKLYFETGESVKKGELIARVKVIPDDVQLSNAEFNVSRTELQMNQAKLEKERAEKLFKDGVISEQEYKQLVFEYKRSKEDYLAAVNNLQLIKSGVSSKQKVGATSILSTMSGMLLDIPLKEGEQVIASNNFNEGTTVALVADMKDLIFEGFVDESEVGKIKEGMDLQIVIGAIEGKSFPAKLEYIAPKGEDDQGTIQFEIRAALVVSEGVFVRAGYSANADIILARRDSVLSIKERDLLFEKGKKYVEVEIAEQRFEKQEVKTGLSDGINVEILEGLEQDQKIKAQTM